MAQGAVATCGLWLAQSGWVDGKRSHYSFPHVVVLCFPHGEGGWGGSRVSTGPGDEDRCSTWRLAGGLTTGVRGCGVLGGEEICLAGENKQGHISHNSIY